MDDFDKLREMVEAEKAIPKAAGIFNPLPFISLIPLLINIFDPDGTKISPAVRAIIDQVLKILSGLFPKT